MDYDFSFDQYGEPLAEFSMDHELVGQWFTDELGSNADKCHQLIDAIETIEAQIKKETVIYGRNLVLTLTEEEATLHGEASTTDDAELTELGLTELDEHAGCGLADFKTAVLDWADFIKA